MAVHVSAATESDRMTRGVDETTTTYRFGRRIARDPEEQGTHGHEDVHGDDYDPDGDLEPAVRQAQQRKGERRLARDGCEDGEEARHETENPQRLEVLARYLQEVHPETQADISCGVVGRRQKLLFFFCVV